MGSNRGWTKPPTVPYRVFPGEYVRLFSDAVEDSRDVKSYCSSCCGYDALQGRLPFAFSGGKTLELVVFFLSVYSMEFVRKLKECGAQWQVLVVLFFLFCLFCLFVC